MKFLPSRPLFVAGGFMPPDGLTLPGPGCSAHAKRRSPLKQKKIPFPWGGAGRLFFTRRSKFGRRVQAGNRLSAFLWGLKIRRGKAWRLGRARRAPLAWWLRPREHPADHAWKRIPMKLYEWHIAPNPRRVTIYLAEKGIQLERVEVGQADLTLAPWYREKYPHAMAPMLELDDGICIGECMAICRYFEEIYPDPPLMGTDPQSKAIVAMWENRANEEGMLAASELFRNSSPAFANRGLPGSADPVPQISELRDRARARLHRFFRKFDAQLADNEFVAGDRYSVADITALCAVDFAAWSDVTIPEKCANLRRWHRTVSARPSAKA
jgi:glutathione S-transferase